jgi:mRNA-degrading endonuclease HigB of HigAB toxin-antitoxin module
MKKSESNKSQNNLKYKFRRIEEFLHEFQNEFINGQVEIIQKHYPDILYHKKLQENILLYSNQIFSVAESVYDKDFHYSEPRLEEELEAMTQVVDKFQLEKPDAEFILKTHLKAKEIMIKFFPELFDLSGNGFRLLEKYCLMYNREFGAGFHLLFAEVHE